MVVFYEARALFDYQPVASDELRLRAGDLIEVRVGEGDQGEEGWLYGSDQRGCHGSFPANYVAEVRATATADNGGGPDEHDHGSEDAPSALPYATQNGSAHAGRSGTPTALSEGKEGVDAQSRYGSPYDSAGATKAPAQSTSSASSVDHNCGYGGPANATTSHPRQVITNAAEAQELTQSFAAIEEGGIVQDADELPHGWLWAIDEASGTAYYYTEDGQSSWTKPLSVAVEALPGLGGKNMPEAGGVSLGSGSLASIEEVTSIGVLYIVASEVAVQLFSDKQGQLNR